MKVAKKNLAKIKLLLHIYLNKMASFWPTAAPTPPRMLLLPLCFCWHFPKIQLIIYRLNSTPLAIMSLFGPKSFKEERQEKSQKKKLNEKGNNISKNE